MISPPTKFETHRLLFRLPGIEDAERVFEEYAADPEVTRYLTWVPHKSKETVVEYLRERIERHKGGQEYTWAIATANDMGPIGMIGARVRGHMVDIGYVLGRRHWNRGYMTEAVSAVVEWMLNQKSIFRVWAVCDTKNIGSARVLEKSNLEREGILRRWIVHPNQSSEPRDCFIYGRVR